MVKGSVTSQDEDDKKANKKGRVIEPLHEEELKKQQDEDEAMAKSNADVLAELAKKAAELAEQVKGPESPKENVLELRATDDDNRIEMLAQLDSASSEDVSESNDNIAAANNGPVNAAADLIRDKLKKIFKDEPDASEEAAEVSSVQHRSVHQEYMYQLTTSGKSLADIQTQWHEYYTALSDEDKHQVWQEFYNNQSTMSAYGKNKAEREEKQNPSSKKPTKHNPGSPLAKFGITNDQRSVADIKASVLDKVSSGGRLKPVHHLKSALFGISLAGFVGLVITFVFFNEIFIAPFISPSRTVSATPIIGNSLSDIGPEPKIIIPKINLEVPVVYGLKTVAESNIQNALEDGVVHYAASPEPGEKGNSVIVGHSSNNILNSGKYKFAFVLLKRLEVDDTFFIHKDNIRYTYKVFEKKIVAPTDVSVLGPTERGNTITLITCDPPGTSINRLIIVAEQISPNPKENSAATIEVKANDDAPLPSNAPSLWSRFTNLF